MEPDSTPSAVKSSYIPLNAELGINLRLILVSGKTKEFLFSPNDSASDIAKHVYDNWPMDWEEEQVSSPNILRLIYQGRFLHGNVTLGVFGMSTFLHFASNFKQTLEPGCPCWSLAPLLTGSLTLSQSLPCLLS
ncbi:hypothetical protein FD755_015680 [Muntiacus reevesi]|uniref:Ubiquitin-like domain-containing protein n=2 Tax=Muntiacus TaxID=9885 RepID=A0A5N3XIL9_MUNRE|nr:hypothetical protein FD754_018124 [Muntiacus muntjak]KAB0372927.1 hypothetical protein FD755_015680 [Muntiacus reevesi]